MIWNISQLLPRVCFVSKFLFHPIGANCLSKINSGTLTRFNLYKSLKLLWITCSFPLFQLTWVFQSVFKLGVKESKYTHHVFPNSLAYMLISLSHEPSDSRKMFTSRLKRLMFCARITVTGTWATIFYRLINQANFMSEKT